MTAGAGSSARSALILHSRIEAGAAADDLDTLVQVHAVDAALRELGFSVRKAELGRHLDEAARVIASPRPDLVFNLVEQVDGRDALLPLAGFLLDRAGIPYTGAPSAALAATTDKIMAKRLMRSAGIPTPDWAEAANAAAADAEGTHWIVKSTTEHASFGLSADSVVPGARVPQRLRQSRLEHGGSWFAERYVEGREFNVALLSDGTKPRALPVAEIVFVDFPEGAPAIVDYDAKWKPESRAYRDTRRRFMSAAEAPLAGKLGELALRCWDLFGLRGYARVDFRVDREGNPWVLEVNANPCLSPDAGFAAAAEAARIGFPEVVARIVEDCGIALPETRRARAG